MTRLSNRQQLKLHEMIGFGFACVLLGLVIAEIILVW